VVDIKNFYLNNPSEDLNMVINFSSVSQDIINEFGHLELAHGSRVYIAIKKGMYGLPQSGILANELLQRRLTLDGYRPIEHIHGLWKHKTHPVWFLLVVDDFGIKNIGRNNAEYLMASIKNKYDISSDWTGSAYCGLDLIGIISMEQLTYICPDTSRELYTSINIQHLHVLNMHHTS
jgi:hypothetical protein